MKKSQLIIYVAIVLSNTCNIKAQQVIANAGNEYHGADFYISWTAGESVIETHAEGGFVFTQGFQQPYSFYLQQILNIPAGWSGISGYIDPVNKSFDEIFAPWINDLVILTSMTGIYFPSQGINTAGIWDNSSGFKVKVMNDIELSLIGTKVKKTMLEIPTGWSLMPVLTSCETPVEELFSGFGSLVMVKQVAGMDLYWPAFNINTLGNVLPGKAYFIAVSDTGSVVFPACNKTSGGSSKDNSVSLNSPWNDITFTAHSHVIAFPESVLKSSGLEAGDVIGAFTSENLCAGIIQVASSQSFALTTFGNDFNTNTKDGFDHGEIFNMRLYKPVTGEEMAMEISYDLMFADLNAFSTNGISAVKSVKLQPLAVADYPNHCLHVFPNPSNGIFNVKTNKWPDGLQIQIMDANGRPVKSLEISNQHTNPTISVDITSFPSGIYLLKLSDTERLLIRKIVKH